MPIEGSPMMILFRKLKRLKLSLRDFNKEHFSSISQRVDLKKKELSVA